MNKRDELSREKYYHKSINRGKSVNVVNLNNFNNLRESSKQKDIPSYQKSIII
jgi:hypothetical protein